MRILLISPNSPPKNSPEAIQVGRLLGALNKDIKVCLVTTPAVKSWAWEDSTLAITREGCCIHKLKLPFHHFFQKLISHRYLSWLQLPDGETWIAFKAREIIKRNRYAANVIYSRSTPFSSALLAYRLKRRLGIPWMMHLSDPWADSIYSHHGRIKHALNSYLESLCFKNADGISFTSEGQKAFYQRKYPSLANKMLCTPNMISTGQWAALLEGSYKSTRAAEKVTFLYTGAFYGSRTPDQLLDAIHLASKMVEGLDSRVEFIFVGNASDDTRKTIRKTPCCSWQPPVSQASCLALQAKADVLICIEPSGAGSDLENHFLPSKVVDYLACGKQLLAISPKNSITSRYCQEGFGWAFAPAQTKEVAELICNLALNPEAIDQYTPPRLPDELSPYKVARAVEYELESLVSQSHGS